VQWLVTTTLCSTMQLASGLRMSMAVSCQDVIVCPCQFVLWCVDITVEEPLAVVMKALYEREKARVGEGLLLCRKSRSNATIAADGWPRWRGLACRGLSLSMDERRASERGGTGRLFSRLRSLLSPPSTFDFLDQYSIQELKSLNFAHYKTASRVVSS
jgi:hypothetical protein